MERAPSILAQGLSITSDGQTDVAYDVPNETAVAVSVNGTTHAVMMATPQHLRDFAIGFALTEGILTDTDQIRSLDIIDHPNGVEAQFWLTDETAQPFLARRRAMAGPVGCGLCGIDSLDQAVRTLPRVGDDTAHFPADQIVSACDDLQRQQPLHDVTHGVHAAGFLTRDHGITIVREDVGRHNALDKLIGALRQSDADPATGAIVLTSRVSVEMVQKTAIAGCGMIIAVSTPTSHALDLAQSANITLCAITRAGQTVCFAHPQRLEGNT